MAIDVFLTMHDSDFCQKTNGSGAAEYRDLPYPVGRDTNTSFPLTTNAEPSFCWSLRRAYDNEAAASPIARQQPPQ
jgi:hypothetical protein